MLAWERSCVAAAAADAAAAAAAAPATGACAASAANCFSQHCIMPMQLPSLLRNLDIKTLMGSTSLLPVRHPAL